MGMTSRSLGCAHCAVILHLFNKNLRCLRQQFTRTFCTAETVHLTQRLWRQPRLLMPTILFVVYQRGTIQRLGKGVCSCQVARNREWRLPGQCSRIRLSCFWTRQRAHWTHTQRGLFRRLWTSSCMAALQSSLRTGTAHPPLFSSSVAFQYHLQNSTIISLQITRTKKSSICRTWLFQCVSR